MKSKLMSEELYELLPSIIKEALSKFTQPHERDFFLLSLMGGVSGCIPKVTGLYDGHTIYPNLYVFIIAPPGSGKGTIKYVKTLLQQREEELANEVKPKQLFLPGNTSAAAFAASLSGNDGQGIVFETEADSLTNAMQQEWGDTADFFNKAYHNETISYNRKEGGTVAIKEPRLSVVLSGPPSQLPALVKTYDNGLFSRFLIYYHNELSGWKNVFEPGVNYKNHFEQLSQAYNQMIKWNFDHPFTLKPTDAQDKIFQDYFAGQLRDISLTRPELHPVVLRLGTHAFKMLMIITAFRRFEGRIENLSTSCTDDDLRITLEVCGNLLDQVIRILNDPASSDRKQSMLTLLMELLPEEFERKDAIELGKRLGLKTRTVDDRLNELVTNGSLIQPKYGKYKKVSESTVVLRPLAKPAESAN